MFYPATHHHYHHLVTVHGEIPSRTTLSARGITSGRREQPREKSRTCSPCRRTRRYSTPSSAPPADALASLTFTDAAPCAARPLRSFRAQGVARENVDTPLFPSCRGTTDNHDVHNVVRVDERDGKGVREDGDHESTTSTASVTMTTVMTMMMIMMMIMTVMMTMLPTSVRPFANVCAAWGVDWHTRADSHEPLRIPTIRARESHADRATATTGSGSPRAIGPFADDSCGGPRRSDTRVSAERRIRALPRREIVRSFDRSFVRRVSRGTAGALRGRQGSHSSRERHRAREGVGGIYHERHSRRKSRNRAGGRSLLTDTAAVARPWL